MTRDTTRRRGMWRAMPRAARILRIALAMAFAFAVGLGAGALARADAPVSGDEIAVAATPEPMGRVVAVRGEVTARSVGGAPRVLRCNDPIYPGDRIATPADGKLGVMSGGVYTGLNERTSAEIGATSEGAPRLDLERGHLRVLDAARGAAPRIATPGLTAFDAGRDTEALVFPEKAWTVSMVCPYENEVSVSRAGPTGQGVQPQPGQCAVDKPSEPVFLAEASHPRLGVIADECPLEVPVAGLIGPRFGSPADVALGPDVAAAGAGLALMPPVSSHLNTQIREPCDIGADCTFRASPFPPVGPPTN